jgi:Glycosyl hydrolases family 16
VGVVVGLLLAILLVIVLVVRASDSGGPEVQPTGGPPGVHWSLQLDENFDGSTATVLGSGTWHPGWFGNGRLTAAVNSRETSLYSADNLAVANGIATFTVSPNAPRLKLANGRGAANLGAAINTDDHQAADGFTMRYGYVEARMQLPAADPAEQVWPSFWVTGHKWPDDMEIDVVEGDGADQGKYNIHYGRGRDTTNLNQGDRVRAVPGATTGMHTYGADIRPDGVTFYYDGAAVYEYRGPVPDAERFVMVGVSSSASVSSPHALLVDHVRAWSRG